MIRRREEDWSRWKKVRKRREEGEKKVRRWWKEGEKKVRRR
jgi:hypothetical protein